MQRAGAQKHQFGAQRLAVFYPDGFTGRYFPARSVEGLPGVIGVIRQGFKADVGVGHVAGKQRVGTRLKAVQHLGDDGVFVYRLIDGLTYHQLVRRRLSGVHRHRAGGQRRGYGGFETGVA